MPFQISIHSNAKSRGVINSFNAGVDQYATCDLELTLTATVNGNLSGHTIMWEQMSGSTQIIWLTPTNQLSVTYAVVGGGSSDRVFRFYIDKGTPLEQFDDVTSWGTPTESEPYTYSSTNTGVSTDTPCRNIPCGSVLSTYRVFPLPSIAGTAVVNPTSGFAINWSWPTCDLSYFIGATVVHNNNGTLTTLGSVPYSSEPVMSVPDLYGTYYIYVNYLISATPYIQYSCRHQQFAPNNLSTVYTMDTMDSYNTSNNTSVVYFSLISETSAVSVYDTYAVLTNTDTVFYERIVAPTAISTEVVPSVLNNTTATYFSNNGIGG